MRAGRGEDSPRYRALMRLYARKLNQAWRGPVLPAEVTAHEARRTHVARGSDPFRAQTIARNACAAVQQVLCWPGWHRRARRRVGEDGPDPAALAVKAARAVRKVRPDLFEGYQGSTQYGGEVS